MSPRLTDCTSRFPDRRHQSRTPSPRQCDMGDTQAGSIIAGLLCNQTVRTSDPSRRVAHTVRGFPRNPANDVGADRVISAAPVPCRQVRLGGTGASTYWRISLAFGGRKMATVGYGANNGQTEAVDFFGPPVAFRPLSAVTTITGSGDRGEGWRRGSAMRREIGRIGEQSGTVKESGEYSTP